MSPLVEIDSASYAHGEVAVLDAVSLAVAPGEFFGIVGPNGSGKTTLLRLMLGLLTPTAGTVRIFDTPVTSFRDWRRLGYMPQRTSIDASLPVTVAEVVATGLLARRTLGCALSAAERARVVEALALVGMEKHSATGFGALSLGQQQRVLIARALVLDPELLVLDEPTGSIDLEAQNTFYSLLRNLNRERGVTLVLVSHDIGVVAREVTRVACLNRTVLFCGPPADVLTPETLGTLYGAPVRLVPHQDPCAHAS